MTDVATTTPATMLSTTPQAEAEAYVDFDKREFATQEEFSKAFFREILDRSGLESFGDMPIIKRIVAKDPDGATVAITLNSPIPPFDKTAEMSIVIGLFFDDDAIRAYTLPKTQGEAKRYCLSRGNPADLIIQAFTSLEQMIDAMAEEYHDYGVLSGVIDDDDDDETPSNGATSKAIDFDKLSVTS
jgi:hypothetical protein